MRFSKQVELGVTKLTKLEEQLGKALLGVLTKGQKDIVPAGPYNHGNGGNFNLPGVNQEFISLVIQPEGLAADLPTFPSMFERPEFGYITGFNGNTGTRAQGVCDDARIPGGVVTCIQTAHFGRYRFDTKPIDITRVGRLTNRAEPTDFTLLNGPLFPVLGNIMPTNVGGAGYANAMFNPKMEMASRMMDVAREYGDLLSHQLWEGDPTDVDGNPIDGGEAEFPGLNILVGTTKIDSRTGTPCDLLKSDIKNFNNWDITRNGGLDLFNALYYIVQTRRFIAKKTNMGQVEWNFVMREAAWNEIVKIWPCIMATYGCMPGVTNSTRPVVNLDNQLRMQQDMWDNRTLQILGDSYRVIIDDALPEESLGGGNLMSDIWFLSRSVKGGKPVLFREYLDYNQGAIPAAQQAGMGETFRTDNGKFLWWNKPNTNVCIQLGALHEERVVLLTPHLCGRLINVAYNPLQHSPDAYRDQLYYNLSGESVRDSEPELYSDWNVSGPGSN